MTTTDVTRHRPTAQLERLRSRLRGAVWLPGESGYDQARSAWNLSARHDPALVVQAADAADISTAVRFALDVGLGVGVLATGHGTGRPYDGGLLINTSALRGVQIDPDARVARVAAGARLGRRDRSRRGPRTGRAAGLEPTVGVVGYTLGGGFGWLGRRYGLAAHSVTRAEVVTGRRRVGHRQPATEHPDLFWGLEGSAGNLGIVTALEFALHPVRDGLRRQPLLPARPSSRAVRASSPTGAARCRRELTAAVTFRSFPPLPTVPEPLRGRTLVALRGCFCGDPADGPALLDQARAALGPAAVDTLRHDAGRGAGPDQHGPGRSLPGLWHTELIRDLTPDDHRRAGGAGRSRLRVAADHAGAAAARRRAGRAGRTRSSPMAHTSAAFSLNAIGVTPDADRAAAVRAHLDKVRTADARRSPPARPTSTSSTSTAPRPSGSAPPTATGTGSASSSSRAGTTRRTSSASTATSRPTSESDA